MVVFETVNELTLKVTCQGNDTIFTKAGAFIAGESGTKNYKFEKVLLGPEGPFHAGGGDLQIPDDVVGQHVGALAVQEDGSPFLVRTKHHIVRNIHVCDKSHAEPVFRNERKAYAQISDLKRGLVS